MDNLVSIIIPNYNSKKYITETLNSILFQKYIKWECIIVDDISTDNSEDIITKFVNSDNRFKFFKRPKNLTKGANTCRNYGFIQSKGTYIVWFDADDIMLPDYLDKMVNNFEKNINMIMCGGYMTDENLNIIKKFTVNKKTYIYKDYFLWNIQIFTNSVLFRKSFLINKTLFNLNLTKGQETDFYSRLFYKLDESNYKVLNEPLFLYRQHTESKSGINKKKYTKKFMKSIAIVITINLEKSYDLKDKQLVYSLLINVFQHMLKSIKNNDYDTSIFYCKSLFKNLITNFWFSIKVVLFFVKKRILKYIN